MELVLDVYIMRCCKTDGGSWTNIYGTTLWSGDEKDRQIIVSRTAIFVSDSVRCVCFRFVLWSGRFCCVLLPGTLLAFHLFYTLINCDCLVYSVSQSVIT